MYNYKHLEYVNFYQLCMRENMLEEMTFHINMIILEK